jgi:hypothetical protein
MAPETPHTLALIWGIWTIVALFFSTQVYMMYYSGNQEIPYAKAFFVQASACYLWALATSTCPLARASP